MNVIGIINPVSDSFLDPAGIMLSFYCLFFGLLMLAFEFSNSPKVNRLFIINFGFYMTFNGRAAFLFFVGFFASGLGKFGAIAGFFSVLDSIFHVYCLKKNPHLKDAMRKMDQDRQDGTSVGTDTGIMSKVVTMAVEDPNKMKQMAGTGAKLAQNPAARSMAAGMATGGSAGGGGAAMSMMGAAAMVAASGQPSPALAEPAPASAPAPAPTYNSDFVVDDYALDDDGTAI